MKSKSHVLVVGECGFAAMSAIESGAAKAAAGVAYARDLEAAALRIAEAQPAMVIVPLEAPDSLSNATALRARTALQSLPLVGLSEEPGDLVFAEALAAGLDDVCLSDGRALARRVRHLSDVMVAPITPRDDTVVVAETDATTRLMIGRVFRNAGYRISFADDAAETLALATAADVRVVIVSAAIYREPGFVERAAASGSPAAWIINTPPREIGAARGRLLPGLRATVHDAFAPAETLLFVANELLNRPLVEARASERLLYGAVVRYRHAGRDDHDVGFLYNLSAGGLYVRTLAPPERSDEMWLEFVPPRSDRIVHIEGTAVWTRRFGSSANATVPCGFGLQITGGSERDLARYDSSYRTFLAERGLRSLRPAGPNLGLALATGS